MVDNIDVLAHSCIRIATPEGKVAYFDPFMVADAPHDADVVLLTHDHYDHYSPEDLAKVANERTTIVAPRTIVGSLLGKGEDQTRIVAVDPGQTLNVAGIPVETLPAYNVDKDFHPRANNWVGYIVTIGGERIYVAGDTDITPENQQVMCDIALIPAGGTYTTTAEEAAQLVNIIHPRVAIPTHYGAIVGAKEDGATFAAAVNPDIETVIKL